MSAFISDAFLKIERAKEHIANVHDRIVTLEESQVATLKTDDTGLQRLTNEIPDLSEKLRRLSPVVGDAIHNLRSALDIAWAALIIPRVPTIKRKRVKFPIYEEWHGIESALNNTEEHVAFSAVCPNLVHWMGTQIQPYKGANDGGLLWVLHDLSNTDKHLLTIEIQPLTRVNGITMEHNGQTFFGYGLPLNTNLHQFDLAGDIKIQDKGKMSLHPSIKEAGVFHNLRVTELLDMFSRKVIYVVKVLEQI